MQDTAAYIAYVFYFTVMLNDRGQNWGRGRGQNHRRGRDQVLKAEAKVDADHR